jgi:hypothetical protein
VLIAALLMMTVWPTPTTSADFDSLVSLAERYPANAVGFWAGRVDNDTIFSLDEIYRGLARRVRGGANEDDLSIRVALDDWADEIQPGETFKTLFRPWLGDTMATAYFIDAETDLMADGFFDFNNLPRVWMIESIDAEVAVDFWNVYLSYYEREFEMTEQDGVVRFVVPAQEWDFDSETGRVYGEHGRYDVVILDDVIVGGTPRFVDRVLTGDFGPSLIDDDTFNETLELFTENDYAAMQYINIRAAVEILADVNDVKIDLSSFEGQLGGQAGGLTMIDERTLTVDYVQYTQNLDQFGFVFDNLGMIDPNFARHIPADAPFVFHGTNLQGVYQVLRTNAEAYFRLTGENEDETGTEGIDAFAADLEAETGVSFEEDILSWMVNDYALFLDFRPRVEDASSAFDLISDLPVDVGVALDVTANPAAAAQLIPVVETALMKQLATMDPQALAGTDVAMEREQIAGAEALVITVTDQTGNIPFPIEVVMASNEEILVVGTRASVVEMLSGEGGLASDEEYLDAQQFLVPQTEELAFIGFPNLLRLVNAANAVAGEETSKYFEDILRLFSHWTISFGADDEQNLRLRFSITVAPEPGM